MPLHQNTAERSKRRQESRNERSVRHDVKDKVRTMSPATHATSTMERCSSRASTLSFNRDFCRICHCDGDNETPLISPCLCSGSLRFVHQSCLQQWIKSSDIKSCELCKFAFVMQAKTKPFSMWEKLEMAASERRKLMCSVAFHAVALTCVVWSLYVLIERTTEEVQSGILEWPFWTKLIVVAIGVTGGVVFMYVQCKVYVQLCRRWRAYNRVIYVQNVPEKPTQLPLVIQTQQFENDGDRSSLSRTDNHAALQERARRSLDAHWSLVGQLPRRASQERRASDVVHWPQAGASAGVNSFIPDRSEQPSCRSLGSHGQVYVTIERSNSSSPMLPAKKDNSTQKLTFTSAECVRDSSESTLKSISSGVITPSFSDR